MAAGATGREDWRLERWPTLNAPTWPKPSFASSLEDARVIERHRCCTFEHVLPEGTVGQGQAEGGERQQGWGRHEHS